VTISTRHQDELEEQASETAWLKNSLMECSNSLHSAVSLLNKTKLDDVPKELTESAAKFNYENVASACKCAICPPMFAANASSSSSGGSELASGVGKLKLDNNNFLNQTDEKNGSGMVMPALPTPKEYEGSVSVFKNLTRDASGLYVIAPPAKLLQQVQQRPSAGQGTNSSTQR